MKKNTPLKIVLIVFITEIIILVGLGIALQNKIVTLHSKIETEEVTSLNDVNSKLIDLSKEVDVILIIGSVAFVGIAIGLSIYMSKVIVYPLNKLLKSKDEEKSTEQFEMRKILLHTTEGIIVFDRSGKIALINPAAKKLLQIAPEDETFEDIFHKFDKSINMEKIIYLDNWTSTTQKIKVEDIEISVLFSPFRDKQNIPAGVIAFIPDVVEHARLDKMQKEFVADVSHELKTPITSIMGYADTLLEGEYDRQTQKEFLGVIATEARRMARLVTDLLELSRLDNNKKKTRMLRLHLFPYPRRACKYGIPARFFTKYTEVVFEGMKFKAIAEYDKYLTLLYGDYMTPPAESERTNSNAATKNRTKEMTLKEIQDRYEKDNK